jgi:hypothetical protein
LTYYRLASQRVWDVTVYHERGHKVLARFRAGERKAALEEVAEQLDV